MSKELSFVDVMNAINRDEISSPIIQGLSSKAIKLEGEIERLKAIIEKYEKHTIVIDGCFFLIKELVDTD